MFTLNQHRLQNAVVLMVLMAWALIQSTPALAQECTAECDVLLEGAARQNITGTQATSWACMPCFRPNPCYSGSR